MQSAFLCAQRQINLCMNAEAVENLGRISKRTILWLHHNFFNSLPTNVTSDLLFAYGHVQFKLTSAVFNFFFLPITYNSRITVLCVRVETRNWRGHEEAVILEKCEVQHNNYMFYKSLPKNIQADHGYSSVYLLLS